MKRLLITLFLGCALLDIVVAQTPNITPTFNQTTLTAAVNSNQQTVAVASGTGIVGGVNTGTTLKIDNEFMRVTVTPAATSGAMTLSVQRGYNGTRATNHGNGSTVWNAIAPAFNACGGTSGAGTAGAANPCGSLYNSGTITNFAAQGVFLPTITVTAISTAGAVTYTPGQLIGGMIARNTNGAVRTDTLPTAALLVAAIPGATVGTSFRLLIQNTGTTDTLTIAVGTGGTGATSNTLTIPTLDIKEFLIRFTNVSSGSEAYTLYSLGLAVF